MLATLITATTVLVAFALKMTAVTGLGRVLNPHVGDRVGSWLAAWLLLHVVTIAFMLSVSMVSALQPLSIWIWLCLIALFYPVARVWGPPARQGISMAVALACFPFFIILGIMAARSFIFQDFTWDGQTYGIPRLAIWMNYGSLLVHMPTVQVNVFTNEWNGELISLVYGLAVGSIQGFSFGGVEVLLLAFLAGAWLIYRLGSHPLWAILGGTVIATTPASLGLASVLKGDLLACTALLMAAAAVPMLRTRPVFAAAMITACAALAFGAKITSAFGAAAIGLTALAVAVATRHGTSFAKGAAIGAALSLIFLSRNILNFIVYGDPLKRVAGETAAPGIDTLLSGMKFIIAQSFRFSIVETGQPTYRWLFAAGLGLTAFFAIGVVILRVVRRERPSLLQIALLLGSLASVVGSAYLIPTYPWSFRYFLPMIFVAVAVLLSARKLSPMAGTALGAVALAVVTINGSYVFWPGEINGNGSFAETARVALNATPHDRALISAFPIRASYGMDEFRFDRAEGLTFGVLHELNRAASPLIGSRAQNRLYLASNVPELIAVLNTHCPDYAVITKELPAPVAEADRQAVQSVGYAFIKDSDLAGIARRVAGAACTR